MTFATSASGNPLRLGDASEVAAPYAALHSNGLSTSAVSAAIAGNAGNTAAAAPPAEAMANRRVIFSPCKAGAMAVSMMRHMVESVRGGASVRLPPAKSTRRRSRSRQKTFKCSSLRYRTVGRRPYHRTVHLTCACNPRVPAPCCPLRRCSATIPRRQSTVREGSNARDIPTQACPSGSRRSWSRGCECTTA